MRNSSTSVVSTWRRLRSSIVATAVPGTTVSPTWARTSATVPDHGAVMTSVPFGPRSRAISWPAPISDPTWATIWVIVPPVCPPARAPGWRRPPGGRGVWGAGGGRAGGGGGLGGGGRGGAQREREPEREEGDADPREEPPPRAQHAARPRRAPLARLRPKEG